MAFQLCHNESWVNFLLKYKGQHVVAIHLLQKVTFCAKLLVNFDCTRKACNIFKTSVPMDISIIITRFWTAFSFILALIGDHWSLCIWRSERTRTGIHPIIYAASMYVCSVHVCMPCPPIYAAYVCPIRRAMYAASSYVRCRHFILQRHTHAVTFEFMFIILISSITIFTWW